VVSGLNQTPRTEEGDVRGLSTGQTTDYPTTGSEGEDYELIGVGWFSNVECLVLGGYMLQRMLLNVPALT
jgi:hypothetical protein